MQEHRGLALWIAAFLEIDLVSVGDREETAVVRLDRGIQRAQLLRPRSRRRERALLRAAGCGAARARFRRMAGGGLLAAFLGHRILAFVSARLFFDHAAERPPAEEMEVQV